MMRIIQGDLSDPRVVNLLRVHLTSARAATAPGSAHALDLSDLQSSDISFWTIWENEILLGIGALKRLSADHGEVKSMHTAQSMRRRGAGSAMLHHIIATARASGMSRLSLETTHFAGAGTSQQFAAKSAAALDQRRGRAMSDLRGGASSASVKSPDFFLTFCFSALTASNCVLSSTPRRA
jgi:putative acetyltransferase